MTLPAAVLSFAVVAGLLTVIPGLDTVLVLRAVIPLRSGSHPSMLLVMSRGPTRRVRRLLASDACWRPTPMIGLAPQAADREADRLGHPQMGLEHFDLGWQQRRTLPQLRTRIDLVAVTHGWPGVRTTCPGAAVPLGRGE